MAATGGAHRIFSMRKHYHGHRQRLRERLADAPEKLADYEVLELLLGHVILRRDTKPIAKALLERFGSLRGVFQARREEYLDIPGIGDGTAGFFALMREVLARYAESPARTRQTLCSLEVVAAMARERLGKLQHEEVWLAYVDGSNRLISWEKASKGTVDSASIFPRDIMERALVLKAKGFIIVHNHPSGDPKPSSVDMELTQRLIQAAEPLRLRLVDHVVVTEDSHCSLKSDGLL